ncbi:ABC transporter substrate-binding protein [Archangium lansingense]|uniref:ABC transporter substrate-binding protein n=1 Tax=Archangium lansingense TaxID=2995310 RepID=UPI003B7824DD
MLAAETPQRTPSALAPSSPRLGRPHRPVSRSLEAATLAVEEINATGGVLGRPLELINRDDRNDPDRGRAAAQALVELQVSVIIGALTSEATLAASEVSRDAQVVLLSSSSTASVLTTAADNGYLFRTCPSDILQSRLVAQRAMAKSFRRVAVIHVPGAYGTGFASAFEADFTALGGTVTGRAEYVEGQTSYMDLLTEVYTGNPEAIVLAGYPVEASQIIRDYLSSFLVRGTFWFFTDALEDPEFITAVGASGFTFAHEGTGPAATNTAPYRAFQTAYRNKYGKESILPIDTTAYDAVYLAALALEAAGQPEGSSVREHLTAVSRDGTPYGPTEYRQAVEALRAGQDINFEGASGPVDLDANGDVVSPYHVWRISGGRLEILEPSVNP